MDKAAVNAFIIYNTLPTEVDTALYQRMNSVTL